MFKKILAAALLAICTVVPTMAQQEEGAKTPFPYVFVGLQGGGQTTLTNYDNCKLITPTASVSVGAWFTPVLGARLHVNGLWNQGGIKMDDFDSKYDYKYATTDLDLMLNMMTLFGKKDYYPLNLYLIGGVGLNASWDNGDALSMVNLLPMAWDGTHLSHNARVGAQLDWNLTKRLSMNLEVAANSLADRYNSKLSYSDDWQITAQLGLAVKFGHKAKAVAPAEEWAVRIDTIWYDAEEYKDLTEDGKMTWNVFYEIRESDFTAEEQLAKIGAFLKEHRECKISVKSYADRGTGNPEINMGYSQQRSEKAFKALVDAGVRASDIKAEYFGDTVQPFEENDKNRVSIITASGLKDLKQKYTVKKYRTEEVRYRVK